MSNGRFGPHHHFSYGVMEKNDDGSQANPYEMLLGFRGSAPDDKASKVM